MRGYAEKGAMKVGFGEVRTKNTSGSFMNNFITFDPNNLSVAENSWLFVGGSLHPGQSPLPAP